MSIRLPRTTERMVVLSGEIWNELAAEVERLGKWSVSGGNFTSGPGGFGLEIRPGSRGLFPVTLTVTSGQTIDTHGGDQTTPATYTYTVTNTITGEEIGTELGPMWGRENGRRLSAGLGTAYYNAGGTLVLFQANELPGTTNCPTP